MGADARDLDNDGRVDAVVTPLEHRLEIWRNVSPKAHHWLLVRAIGSRSPRDAVGTKIRVTTASGVQHNHVNTAVGYGCASDRRVHFGLGSDAVVEELRVEWPSGLVQTLRDVPTDQILTVREDEAGATDAPIPQPDERAPGQSRDDDPPTPEGP